MFCHTTKLRVRYGETDQMGVVYYGNYAQYYEVGRVEMIRALGLTYKDLEDKKGILMPVKSMEMRFVRPAKYDDEIKIKTCVKKMPIMDIIFHVEIFGENDKLLNGGQVKLCFVDKATKKVVPTPPEITERLQSFFKPA